MKDTPLAVGIIGCGDFLRWQMDSLRKSKRIKVCGVFDTDEHKARKAGDELHCRVYACAEDLMAESAIQMLCLFVPPWVREKYVAQTVAAGKHFITTKPLANTVEACERIMSTACGQVTGGVIYRRTENGLVESLKRLLDSGTIGQLGLYRQDWLHHYPQWNDWALDPARNGGPFMDAMIHNLNIARYLMGRPVTRSFLFSDSHAHSLPCNDTEFLKVDFEGRGSAHLFISWAADLAVYSTTGNDREHIDLFYLITNQGWRITDEHQDGNHVLVASRLGEQRVFQISPVVQTAYDSMVGAIRKEAPLTQDVVSITDAAEDIAILSRAQRV